jgi:APA family basic amino acid/polyamine antiporter
MTPQTPHLERKFGVLQATALNMTNMIGVGPFISIPALLSAMNGPQAMIGWFVALAIALVDGMVWAELSTAFPGSGGSYVYLKEAFGPRTWGRLMAFLFIWQFILSGPLEIASGIIGIAQYLNFIWKGKELLKFIPIAVGLVCLVLLYRKIESIGKITIALWIGTILTTLAVIVAGLTHFDPKRAFDFEANAFQFSTGFLFGLGAAAQVGLYDYLGYYDICYIGEEVRNPRRTMVRSIFWSLLLVAGLYICVNLSIIGVVPWRELVPVGDPPAPVASLLIERLYGRAPAVVITVMVIWTALGSVFALILGYSRIPYAAARDGNFFAVFGKLHPTKDFPHISIVVITALSVACSYSSLMDVIGALLVTRIIVQFIGQVYALVWLREKRREPSNIYRMPFYPWACFLALAGWSFIFFTFDVKFQLYGLKALGLGVVVFLIWAFLRKNWPFGPKS